MNRKASLLLALGLVASGPSTGHAYSDPSRFSEAVTSGGGDNRWFTGSPADGFSCAVCHGGQQGLDVTVSSLPEMYQPGQTYEILVAWGNPLAKVAANVEITDELGRPVGVLSAPTTAVLQPADECEPKGMGIGASQVFTLADGRQVLGFADCGASQVRWQWTAPALAAGTAFLSGALVVADHDETLEGDGVTVLARTMLAPGQEPLDTRATGNCSVTPRSARGATAGGWLVTCVALAFGMRRLSKRPGR